MGSTDTEAARKHCRREDDALTLESAVKNAIGHARRERETEIATLRADLERRDRLLEHINGFVERKSEDHTGTCCCPTCCIRAILCKQEVTNASD